MSWEEDFRKRYPCPCGNGEIEEIHKSDDWGRHEIERNMLCTKCHEEYVYDHTIVYGHPGDEVERGWVNKSVLFQEHEHIAGVEAKVRELYFNEWEQLFTNTRKKKDLWRILTMNGIFHPPLSTFYKHTRNYNHEQLMKYISSFFRYEDFHRVFEILKLKPDPNLLGFNENEINKFLLR